MAVSQGQRIAVAAATVVLAAVGVALVLGIRGPKDKPTREDQDASDTKKSSTTTGDQSSTRELKDAEQLKKEGNNRFNIGKYEEAIELYSQAININPKPEDLAKYYANRAACHSRLKNFEEVVADCTKALELNPGYVKALHRRAQAYESLERLDDAVRDYGRGVRLQPSPSDHQAMSQSADLVLQKIAQKKAKEKLKEKKGLFPANYIIKSYLCTFKQKEVTETEAELKSAADTDAMAAYKLGLCRSQKGKYSVALECFTKAVELDDGLAVAHAERGTLLHLSGDMAAAVESFTKAVTIDPSSVDALVKWANTIFFLGDADRANSILQQAIAIDPRDTVPYYHAGQAMSQQENFDKAVEYFTKVLELDPKHYAALNHRGMAYANALEREVNANQAQHAVEMAIQDYEKAIQVNTSEPDAYNSYGVLLRLLGRTEEAIKMFDQAIQVAPKAATAYTNKGFHKLHIENDKQAAKELFMKALEVDPTCIEALCNLAIVHLETSVDEAVKCYDQAIELSFFEQDLATIYTFREAAVLSKEIGMTQP